MCYPTTWCCCCCCLQRSSEMSDVCSVNATDMCYPTTWCCCCCFQRSSEQRLIDSGRRGHNIGVGGDVSSPFGRSLFSSCCEVLRCATSPPGSGPCSAAAVRRLTSVLQAPPPQHTYSLRPRKCAGSVSSSAHHVPARGGWQQADRCPHWSACHAPAYGAQRVAEGRQA